MTERGITRLARRLAEENNVDWRSLSGSGEDGQIVEMDVLDYLARVMAGEEALDPTPEPLPEGLEAWPDQDRFGTGAGEANAWDEAAADDDGFDFAEDIFLFDDETPAEATSDSDQDTGTAADTDDDWLFRDEEVPAGGLFEAYPDSGETEKEGTSDWDLPGDDLAGLGDWNAEPAETEETDPGLRAHEQVFGSDDKLDDSEFSGDDLFDLALEDGELDDPLLTGSDLREFELGYAEESLEDQAARTEDLLLHEETTGDSAESGSLPEDFSVDDLPGTAEDDEALRLARRIEAAFESVADEPPSFGDFEDDYGDDMHGLLDEPTAEEDGFAHFSAGEGDSGDEAEAAAGIAPLAATQAFPGHVLRRRLDVSALDAACALARNEVPEGSAAEVRLVFLLLAARRAAAASGFRQGTGSAAAATVAGAAPEYFTGLGETAGFRELSAALRPGSGGDADAAAGAALVAVDLGSLGVDELLLPLPVPVVTLGSSLDFADSGEDTAIVSLAGEFDINAGAAFLAELAGLLAEPLRILL